MIQFELKRETAINLNTKTLISIFYFYDFNKMLLYLKIASFLIATKKNMMITGKVTFLFKYYNENDVDIQDSVY